MEVMKLFGRKKFVQNSDAENVIKAELSVSPEEKRILERMSRISGRNITAEEMIEAGECRKSYTREYADFLIANYKKGPAWYAFENDDGPVFYTRDEMIQKTESLVT